MTDREKNGSYICINQGEAWGPEEIREKSIYVDMDLAKALEAVRGGL